MMVMAPLCVGEAAAKRKPAKIITPELRILTVVASPDPYSPGTGVVEFTVEIELPKELDGATLLEVSSLISSASMRSMRFIATRQPVQLPEPSVSPTTAQPTQTKPRMSVTLTWDGLDQSKQVVESGRYHYEVRAKLLAVGENGPRTQKNSWPKRGILMVK
jgi:hypothetical protein